MPVSFINIEGKAGERKGGWYAIVSRPGQKPRAVFTGIHPGVKKLTNETYIANLQKFIDRLY
ncbi:hypothetical protein ARHIZOSPH14_20810 [Agromyces rhizosphaerae]|uniref:Uncharacterized protein n=1 Tax=Agromyces rhizosphaerae TaxID=88374 RepID=A0A9W6FPB1_9MICO|nr:hypothetical protein [Agromyces rhizosphaerae]GLI27839.1 hypothetical protein ARHIZOSPH14_20810 [Agromyces rhizosphaerae]